MHYYHNSFINTPKKIKNKNRKTTLISSNNICAIGLSLEHTKYIHEYMKLNKKTSSRVHSEVNLDIFICISFAI